MPTIVSLGSKVAEIDLVGLFEPSEGELNQISGKIGNGKTLLATELVLEDLSFGEIVYTNWPINYQGYDERSDWFRALRNFIFGNNRFYSFPAENLRRIAIDDNFADTISQLNNCKIYLDEGHVAFDSYEMAKMSMKKRAAILHTRHYNRTIVVISQRPTAIHATIRDNVNRYIRCEKLFTFTIPFFKKLVMVFRRTYTQSLRSDGNPDFDDDYDFRKISIPGTRVLKAYNTRYLSDGMDPSQPLYFDAYDLNFSERFQALYYAFGGRRGLATRPQDIPGSFIESRSKPFKWEDIKKRGEA